MIREPSVAGHFYPDDPLELQEIIKSCASHKYGPGHAEPGGGRVLGIVSPHAGYAHSGPIASSSYNSISAQDLDLVILAGPDHFGMGTGVATMAGASWRTPFGLVEVDSEAAREISDASGITIDNGVHLRDHSLEVQLPMLQATLPTKFKILPILLSRQDQYTAEDVGQAMYRVSKDRKAVLIASSDFTHYEPNSFAHRQDEALIEPILELDTERFYDTLQTRRISACGYGAIASVMHACGMLGASRGILLRYATSGDVSGDTSSVVGYGAIKFVR